MIANEGGLRTVAQLTGKEFTTVGLLFWKVHRLNHQQWSVLSFLYTRCSQLNQSWRSIHTMASLPRKPIWLPDFDCKKKSDMNEQPDVMANLWMHWPLMVSPNSGRTGTEWPAFHGKVTRLHNDSSIQVNTTIDVLFLVWFFRFQNWLPKRYTYLALLLNFALGKQKIVWTEETVQTLRAFLILHFSYDLNHHIACFVVINQQSMNLSLAF